MLCVTHDGLSLEQPEFDHFSRESNTGPSVWWANQANHIKVVSLIVFDI